MKSMEVFFDYSCPYCLSGYEDLKELMKQSGDMQIVWCPCEAHPRPDRYGVHSDLAIRAMFLAQDKGVDMWAFHDTMYSMIHAEKLNVEKAEVLAEGLQSFLDKEDLMQMLHSDQYVKALAEANHYAYQQSGVWAVPAYRMAGKKLDSVENIGVAKIQLKEFMIA